MMNMIPKKYQDLLDEFPFLTLIKYGGNEYVGIIQNGIIILPVCNLETLGYGQTNMNF